jgi:hypothetical protein
MWWHGGSTYGGYSGLIWKASDGQRVGKEKEYIGRNGSSIYNGISPEILFSHYGAFENRFSNVFF